MKSALICQASAGCIVVLTFAATVHADPLDQWTWSYPRPQGNTLRAVTYGGGQFVAVGDYGTIVSSGDGYHWTNQTFLKFPNLHGVAFAGGSYVAVGDSGTILTSSNAANWIQATSPTANTLWAVAVNPSPSAASPKFMAVGDQGAAVSSMDAATWTNWASGTTNNLRGVAFGSTNYLGVGDNGTILYGMNFDLKSYFPPEIWPTTNNLRCIASGGGVYTSGGDLWGNGPNNSILFAPDGFNWDEQTISNAACWSLSQGFNLNAMAFGGGQFVAVGDTGHTLEYDYPGVLFTSSSGTNWVELSAFTSENSLYGVAYGNGLFVAVGGAGAILVSTNGAEWAEVTGYHRSAITAIASSGSLCVAAAQPVSFPRDNYNFPDFSTLVSSNGVDWIVSGTNLPPMSDLAASGGLFVGVSGNCIFTTTDGFVWATNCISSNTLHGLTWANDRFLAVGDGETIFSSFDGSNWSKSSHTGTNTFYCATFGNGLYIAAGAAVAVSTDAVSWSLSSNLPPLNLRSMLYANGLFVAAGNSALLTSQNGTNWQVRYSVPGYWPGGNIPSVAYGNGEYVAIAATSVLKSVDGANWTPSVTGLPWLFSSWYIYYGYPPPHPTIHSYQGTFLVAGMDGILMQSGDTRIPVLLGSAQMQSNGFTFAFKPEIGQPYRVQGTTNLYFWENLFAAVGSNQPTTFVDTSASVTSRRFFRVVSP